MGYGFVGERSHSEVARNRRIVSARELSSGVGLTSGHPVGTGLGLASAGGAGSVIQSEVSGNVNGRAEDFASDYGEYRYRKREDDGETCVIGSRSGGSFVAYVAAEAKVQLGNNVDVGAFGGNGGVFAAVESGRRIAAVQEKQEDTEEGSKAAAARDLEGRELKEDALLSISGKPEIGNSMQGPTEAFSHAETLATTLEASREEEGEVQHPQHLYASSEVEKQKAASQEGIGGGSSCKECGNQAKKDCRYQRCRTCCKSRDFNCPTHIKSTWVPVSKRRERLQADGGASSAEQPLPKSKRARNLPFVGVPAAGTSITATSPVTSPHGSDINSSHPSQSASPRKGTLPAEVKSDALFKCVRVTGVDDGQEEFAYQVTVKIGGHLFKGVLYDQGVDKTTVTTSLSDLQLGARSVASSSALVDSTTLYGSPGTLLGGISIF
ncbi:hypothetical protein O6H91_04G062800 [Diphasiastrum complanatum]|uniref:Uncharacterized protein n=1 Tax=Diphasiastrum complanatum TaxID=34168 RepID=A0ACC2DXP6_DIPCM|nr:hypothetical protein O6H91_04G062800 [Diphasiastrum complanatum]